MIINKENAIFAYKGFDKNFYCRGFQYEIGKKYHITGNLEICKNGFHACKDLTNIFNYYSMVNSRFAIVKLWDDVLYRNNKVCASNIEIVKELSLKDIVERYALPKVDYLDKTSNRHIVLNKDENELYINGGLNYVFSNYSNKTIITTGDENNIITTGAFNTIINFGYKSNINCYGTCSNLVSIGNDAKIILCEYPTAALYGNCNNIILASDYGTVVSNGNYCLITIISNFAHCTTNGEYNKIIVTGNSTIDSKGINDELVLNGDNIKFKAKYGSTITCVGRKKMIVDDKCIVSDTWYRYVYGNIQPCDMNM